MFLGNTKPHKSFIVDHVRELLFPYMLDSSKHKDRAAAVLSIITDFELSESNNNASKAALLIHMICCEANASKIETKKAFIHWSIGISHILSNTRTIIQRIKPLELTLMSIAHYLVEAYSGKDDFCESFKTAMQTLKDNLKEENDTHKKTLAVDDVDLVRSSKILEVFEGIMNNLMSQSQNMCS